MIDLSIIIVNYNVKEFLKNLLQSLEPALKNLRAEIIVVDNASTDGSPEFIEQNFPTVKLIRNKINVGFGRANNQAMEIASGKYFVLINPDTIVKENTFEKLIDFFNSTRDAGMVGCKVLNPDGTLQLACRRSFPGPWTSFTKVTGLSTLFPKSKLFARYNLTYLDENETNEVDAISGAFMMFKKEVYEKIGGFDQQFFMYGEDLDLCYRTQQAGYKVYYVPNTEIIHYKGESTKRSNIDETRMFYDAMHLFVKKHFSAFFLGEWVLRIAIVIRQLISFLNVYRLPIMSALADIVLFIVCLILAEHTYSSETWKGFPEFVKPWVYIIPAIIQMTIALLIGAYKKNYLSNLRIIFSLLAGLIIISSLTYFFKQFGYSRAVILICYTYAFFVFSFWRIIAKTIFHIGTISQSFSSNSLIVGEEISSSKLIHKLRSNVNRIFKIRGLISRDQKDVGKKVGNYEIVGSLDNIRNIIVEHDVHKVIFISGDISFDRMFGIVSKCQGLNVEFLVTGEGHDYLVGKSEITLLEDIPLMKLEYNISRMAFRFIKRFFDFMLAFFVLIFVYPFVYFAVRKKNNSDFGKFILNIPSVLSGRKSFVGPLENSYLDGLFIGKIGLTGLWYIESIDISDKDELKNLDVYYAKNQNIWLDLEILGKTLSKMFIKPEN